MPSKTFELNIVPLNQYSRVLWDIALVGVGGTGGYVVQSLARMMKAFNIEGCLTLADGDVVEEHNLGRQNFVQLDVGKKKVDVLARRYGNVHDIDIRMIGRYLEDIEAVEQLFTLMPNENTYVARVLIGCVDNNATRRLLHEYFMASDNLIYLDAGNDGVLPISESVSEEDERESGYSGQVVLGLRHNGRTILEPIGGVYSNVLSDTSDFFPSQACGKTVVNYPQRMQTNEMAATVVKGYLNTILPEGTAVSHYVNFNARNQVMRPEYITREYFEGIQI